MQRLIIGTYPTGETAGSGEGLWEVFVQVGTGELTGARQLVEIASPSFVALHPNGQTLFAVSELDEGTVTALTLTPDALEVGETRPTQGVHPCHVVARDEQVWVANYSSGTFTALGLDATAAFTGQVQSFGNTGTGPDADRQEGPHAHFCLPAPDGDGAWVVDLGTDELRRYTAAGAAQGSAAPASGAAEHGVLVADGVAATLPPGSGPRHAAVHPGGTVFVVGELDSRVHLLRPAVQAESSRGAWEAYASVPACVTPDPGTGSYPSHIALSADGSRLYVAVRGPDVLSTFAVTPDGSGATHLADTPIGGVWPRHFAVLAGETTVADEADAGEATAGRTSDGSSAADVVVVANQNSSTLTVLRIDRASGTGTLTATLDLPAPACVLPV